MRAMTVESSYGPPSLPAYKEPEAVVSSSPTPNDGNANLKPFDDDDGPSFSDLLDVINPLQHIPVINSIYRELTGDTEGVVADVMGGALWGGPIGLGAAVANLLIEDSTGKSVEGHVMALFSDDAKDTAIASNAPATSETADLQQAAPSQNNPSNEPIAISSLAGTTDKPAGQTADDNGPVAMGDFMVFGGPATATASAAATASDRKNDSAAIANGDATLSGAADGPARNGDFMVFGAAGAGTLAAAAATASSQKANPASVTATAASPANPGTATRSGDFMVFGNTSQSTGTATAQAVPTPAAAVPTALTPAATDAKTATSANQQTAAATTQPGRSFPTPTQRNTVTPRQTLPMPTTGPAAVPGNAKIIAQNRSNTPNTDQSNNAWFVGAFNDAMDKYNKAANLGTITPASQKPANGETANSILQMN